MRPSQRPSLRQNLITYAIVAALMGVLVVLTIAFFRNLPPIGNLGIDWDQIYPAIENGKLDYGVGGLRNPPWTGLLLLPFGWLSHRDSWAILTLFTLIVLMVSVPRKYGKRGLYAFAMLLLFTAYPTMRHFADGNLEGLIIGGILLLLYAYQQENLWLLCVGLLCVTAKPQETFLLVLVLGLWLWQRWQWRHWLAAGLLTLLVMGATLAWQGQAFLDSLVRMPDRGQLMDISLTSSVARLGLPNWVTLVAGLAIAAVSIFLTFRAQPRFDRERAALLLAASMLASPYTAGNSYLTIIAIGVIPLFLKQPILGLILILLCEAQYVFPREFNFSYGAYFSTMLLFISWLVFAMRVRRERPAR